MEWRSQTHVIPDISPEEDGGSVEQSFVDGLELGHAVFEGDPYDIDATQRHHLGEVALVHRVDRFDTEAGRDHAAVRGRRPAPDHLPALPHPRPPSLPSLDPF